MLGQAQPARRTKENGTAAPLAGFRDPSDNRTDGRIVVPFRTMIPRAA